MTNSENNNTLSFDIRDYAKIYKNMISQELSDEILNNLKNQKYMQHEFYNYNKNDSQPISGNQELDISYDYRNEELEKIVWNLILKYIEELNLDWFKGWNGFSLPRWHKYEENRKMALHADRIKSLFDGERKGDPTLTVLGIFKTEFTGGEFVMWEDDKILDYSQGDIIIFPSTFMYPHKVEPILSGERHSFVSWVW